MTAQPPPPAASTPPEPEPLREFAERLGPQLEEVTERLSDTNERVKTFIRQNPGTCLLGAAALGFFIGRWASRR